MDDVFDVLHLCQEYGEGNVDIRNIYELIAAIQEGRLHLLIDQATGEIIGCVSVYSYPAGERQHNEIGTLVLNPAYRGFGLADFLVIFSSLCSLLADPGSICVSEIYPGSVKAEAVLERNGFRKIVPCHWRISHAKAASRPVIHLELDNGPLPVMAGQLLIWVNGGAIARNGVKVRILFGDGYWIDTEAGREVLRQIGRGDLRAIQDNDEEESPEPPKGTPPHPPGPASGRRNRPH